MAYRTALDCTALHGSTALKFLQETQRPIVRAEQRTRGGQPATSPAASGDRAGNQDMRAESPLGARPQPLRGTAGPTQELLERARRQPSYADGDPQVTEQAPIAA